MTKRLVLAAVLVAIAFGTHCPSGMAGEILKTLGINDSVAHMLMYGVLGAVVVFVGARSGWLKTMFVAAVLVAAADEMTQPFVGREASFDDFLFDMIGLLGVGGVLLLTWACMRPLDAAKDAPVGRRCPSASDRVVR